MTVPFARSAVVAALAIGVTGCTVDRWQVRGQAAWFRPQPSGHVALASSARPNRSQGRDNDVEDALGIDDPADAVVLRAEARADRWRLRAGGTTFDDGGGGTLQRPFGDLPAGDPVRSEIGFDHVDLLLDYGVLQDEHARLGLGLAASYVGVDVSVRDRISSVREAVRTDAVVPMPTASGELTWGPATLAGSIGGWGGDLGDASGTWLDAETTLSLRPDPHFEVFGGYRWFRSSADGRADDRRFQGEITMSGFLVGIVVKFGGRRGLSVGEGEGGEEGGPFRPPLY